MWSLPESLLQPLLQRLRLERLQKRNGEQMTAKQFLLSSDPTLKNVVAKEALQWRRGQITQVKWEKTLRIKNTTTYLFSRKCKQTFKKCKQDATPHLIWRHKGKVYFYRLIDQTVSAMEKLQMLENDWQNILYKIIRDTLVDYSGMDEYMKRCSTYLDSDKWKLPVTDIEYFCYQNTNNFVTKPKNVCMNICKK